MLSLTQSASRLRSTGPGPCLQAPWHRHRDANSDKNESKCEPAAAARYGTAQLRLAAGDLLRHCEIRPGSRVPQGPAAGPRFSSACQPKGIRASRPGALGEAFSVRLGAVSRRTPGQANYQKATRTTLSPFKARKGDTMNHSTYDWQTLFGTPPAEFVMSRILVDSVLLFIWSRFYNVFHLSISNFYCSSKVRDFCNWPEPSNKKQKLLILFLELRYDILIAY
jgi:hypothetical protein